MKTNSKLLIIIVLLLYSCSKYTVDGYLVRPLGTAFSGQVLTLAEISQLNISRTQTDSNGYFRFTDVKKQGTYTLKLEWPDTFQFVSTTDMVLVSKIYKQEMPLDSIPYWQFIASDANLDGVVDNKDIVEIRAWILTRPHTPLPGWRLIESDRAYSKNNSEKLDAVCVVRPSKNKSARKWVAVEIGDPSGGKGKRISNSE